MCVLLYKSIKSEKHADEYKYLTFELFKES